MSIENERVYLTDVSIRDLDRRDAERCEGLNFEFFLKTGAKILEAGSLYVIVSNSDWEEFGRDRWCEVVYSEHSSLLDRDFLNLDFARIANDPSFHVPKEIRVTFKQNLSGSHESLFESEAGMTYCRQDNVHEGSATWVSSVYHKGEWVDYGKIRPNVTFVMGDERETVTYSNWGGTGVWGEHYNKAFSYEVLGRSELSVSEMVDCASERVQQRGVCADKADEAKEDVAL